MSLMLGLSLALVGCGGSGPGTHTPSSSGATRPSSAAHTLYLLGGTLTAVRNGRTLWQVLLPQAPLRSALAVADGVVYAGDADLLLAFDATTGKPRWSVSAGPGIEELLVVGAMIYVGSGALIYAFDWQGTLRWRQTLGYTNFTTLLLSQQGILYVGKTGSLFALDAAGGRVLWQRSSSQWEGVQHLLLVGTILLARIAGGGVVAVSSTDGKLLWQRGRNVLALALSLDQRILYTIYIDAPPAQMGLRALWVKDGTTLWKVVTPVAPGEQAVVTSQAFYRATGPTFGDLSAWRTSDGSALWQIESGATISAMDASTTNLYVISAEGLTSRQTSTGALRWKDADLTTGAQLVVQDGILYTIGLDGQITALDAGQGRELYQYQAGYFNQLVIE